MEREIYLFVIKRVGVDDLSIPRCRLGATIEVVAGFFRFYESEDISDEEESSDEDDGVSIDKSFISKSDEDNLEKCLRGKILLNEKDQQRAEELIKIGIERDIKCHSHFTNW